jgi:hypothetical protein
VNTTAISLEKREAQTILLALGIAIEQSNHALSNCYDRRHHLISDSVLKEVIRERKQTLSQFERLRERIASTWNVG